MTRNNKIHLVRDIRIAIEQTRLQYFPTTILFDYQINSIISSVNYNTIVSLPTGKGKSLIILFNILVLSKLLNLTISFTIVIEPLLNIIKDQISKIHKYNNGLYSIKIEDFNDLSNIQEILSLISEGSLKYIFCCPETFRNKVFIENFVKHKGMLVAVVDECHCMVTMGTTKDFTKIPFRPEYGVKLADLLLSLDCLLLFATATYTITIKAELESKRFFKDANFRTVTTISHDQPYFFYEHVNGTSSKNPEYFQRIVFMYEKFFNNYHIITELDKIPIILIFIATIPELTFWYNWFLIHLPKQFPRNRIRKYHADMGNQKFRDNELLKWVESDEIIINLVTNSFAMGVDKRHIDHIVLRGMPKVFEGYVQKAGRAGRDGSKVIIYFYCLNN
jgi:ATP-dependent DNA helicase RecQ